MEIVIMFAAVIIVSLVSISIFATMATILVKHFEKKVKRLAKDVEKLQQLRGQGAT